MKTLAMGLALGIALPATGALAQSVVEMRSPKGSATEHRAEAPDPGSSRYERTERKNQWRMDRPRDDQASESSSKPPQGARFHISSGRNSVGLTCPDNETMRACADVLMDVIDRVQSRGERLPPRDEGYSGSLRNSEPQSGGVPEEEPRLRGPSDYQDLPPRPRVPD